MKTKDNPKRKCEGGGKKKFATSQSPYLGNPPYVSCRHPTMVSIMEKRVRERSSTRAEMAPMIIVTGIMLKPITARYTPF